MSLVSLSAMQLTVTLTTMGREGREEEEEEARGGAADPGESAWMARWTVKDLPVPGSPLM